MSTTVTCAITFWIHVCSSKPPRAPCLSLRCKREASLPAVARSWPRATAAHLVAYLSSNLHMINKVWRDNKEQNIPSVRCGQDELRGKKNEKKKK